MIWERSQAPPENKDSYIHWSVGARRAGRARRQSPIPAPAVRHVLAVTALAGTGWRHCWGVSRTRARAFTMGRRAGLCRARRR